MLASIRGNQRAFILTDWPSWSGVLWFLNSLRRRNWNRSRKSWVSGRCWLLLLVGQFHRSLRWRCGSLIDWYNWKRLRILLFHRAGWLGWLERLGLCGRSCRLRCWLVVNRLWYNSSRLDSQRELGSRWRDVRQLRKELTSRFGCIAGIRLRYLVGTDTESDYWSLSVGSLSVGSLNGRY